MTKLYKSRQGTPHTVKDNNGVFTRLCEHCNEMVNANCIMTIKPDGAVFFRGKEVVGDDDFKAMMKDIHDVLCGAK